MAVIDKFTVVIKVNGQNLKEYTDDSNQDDDNPESSQTQTTKFIEAQEGQASSICLDITRGYRLPAGASSIAMTISADGKWLQSTLVEFSSKPLHKGINYVHDAIQYFDGFGFKERELLFKVLQNTQEAITGDIEKIKEYSAKGTIRIDLRPYEKVGQRQATSNVLDEDLKVPEKATKGRAVTLGVGLGLEKPSQTVTYCKGQFVGIQTSFIFEYRTTESLKQLMIIPRTPSPEPEVPLVERDPATLSVEEARQVIEELKASQRVKPEGDVKKEHVATDTVRKRRRASTPDDEDELQVISIKKTKLGSTSSETVVID